MSDMSHLKYAVTKQPFSRVDKFKLILLRLILPKQIIVEVDSAKWENRISKL